MDYSIKNINGFTEQDLKNLNDNFKYIKMKMFETIATTTSGTTTETATTETLNPLISKIELSDGDITIYATCKIKNSDNTYTIKKASYVLKSDGLYNYSGKLILPIEGVSSGSGTNPNPVVSYIKFY